MTRTSTSEIAAHLRDALPRGGYPVSNRTARRELQRRFTFKLSDADVQAAIALATARGDVMRLCGGTVLCRATRG